MSGNPYFYSLRKHIYRKNVRKVVETDLEWQQFF